MESIVAIDIETTGLDPDKDAIIEIGAVKFNERRVEAEWSTLINPGRPIPPFITQLTGINDRMVRGAPTIRTAIAELRDFVSDLPVLGHSVRFDLSFLRRYGILHLNEVIDTYEMAAVLMPRAGRYNLGALGQSLNVPLSATHRALDDARVTRVVFQRLYEQALQLALPLLAEIVRLGEPIDWHGYWPFKQALRTRSRETISGLQAGESYLGPLFDLKNGRPPAPLQPNATLTPLDPDEVAAILEYGGAFSRHFPYYEYRPQQVEMLRVVTQTLASGGQLLVEAGTGTGKSIAYLIPAALWALKNNTRVVISTNTINLQDQLINKDIPDLIEALNVDLRAAVLKGRANYLCPRRLELLRRRGPGDPDEMRVLAKILVWLQSSTTGDRSEINLNGQAERDIWARICAEDEGCTAERCLKRTGGACPFYRARQSAQCSHILIVNHALLLSDITTGSRVLPEYQYLIIDEAHHLEDATTNAMSFEVTQFDLERLLKELGSEKSGVLGFCLTTLEGILPPGDFASFFHLVQRSTDLAFNLDHQFRQFFDTLVQFMAELREGRPASQYAVQERILPSTRTQPGWASVELCWEETESTMKSLLKQLEEILKGVASLVESLPEESEDLFSSLSNVFRRLDEYHENLEALVFKPSADMVYWVELSSNGRRLSLHAAPLHVGPLMDRFLWREKESVILTSATLTAAGEFDYLKSRLLCEDAEELALGSPFDYENAALVYIANDIPEPGDRYGHQRAIESGIVHLARATGGRMLVLFTSYEQLRRTSQAISSNLAKFDIQVYEQGEGASPHSLLETFRSSQRAILLGTRSFWEGVDVPGDALSVLVIVKLPFDVPSDPIVAARSETFDDPFNQYSLPEAILRFRQGFGRLIRTQADRGVVAVFDKRVKTKRYGQLFIDSLPACSLKEGPLSALPRAAAQWLNL